jgi:hypothetical protein
MAELGQVIRTASDVLGIPTATVVNMIAVGGGLPTYWRRARYVRRKRGCG